MRTRIRLSKAKENTVTTAPAIGATGTTSLSRRPVRLGVIGCGRIAQAAHLPAVAKTDEVELIAVCDPSVALAEGVGGRYGVRAYVSSEQLLGDDIEAVIIATPDRFHHPLGVRSLEAGKHVLMEKPLAATSEQASALAELAAARNLRLQTGAMKRHDPGIAFARRHLGEIGDIVSFSSTYRIPAMRAAIEHTVFPAQLLSDQAVRSHEDSYKAQANRAFYLLATHGAHVFDLLIYFAGIPRWIRVEAGVVGADYTWHGIVGLIGGGIGSFEITVDVHADASEGFEVFGTKGSIRAATYQPFWKRASDVEVYLEDDNLSLRPHPRDTNAFKLQVEGFARAIRAGGGENPSPQDGIWAVRLIEAARRSADNDGEKVQL